MLCEGFARLQVHSLVKRQVLCGGALATLRLRLSQKTLNR